MSAEVHRETSYRPDIDGLRALAVVPVLLFHAEVPGFSGGFVGVDIFFVISGYLITRIILRDLSLERFSMLSFIERRVRRILPALYIVMVACIPAAWFLMLADDFENFGQSTLATVVSANNVLLWLTSGYWGMSSEFKPLLHTWSLGVEEQFYLGYPLLLLVLSKFRRSATAWVIAAVWIASIVSAQVLLDRAPSAVFLLLPFRMFELLTGALLAWWEIGRPGSEGRAVPRGASWLCMAGFTAICTSVVCFDDTSAVPGYAALLPVAGAAVLIACGNNKSPVRLLLVCKPVVGLGVISYSLYLWHQPLIAFFRMSCPNPPSPFVQALVALAAIPLAWASCRWVEKPFRDPRYFSRKAVFLLAILFGVALGGVGLVIDHEGGFPNRVPGMTSDGGGGRRITREMYVDRIFQYTDRSFVDPAKPNVLVLGNSFGRDFINSAIENGYMTHVETCYLPVNNRGDFGCFAGADAVSAQIRGRLIEADIVVLVQGDTPTFNTACWDHDLSLLKSLGAKRVILVGTKNFGWNPNAIMSMGESGRHNYRPRVKDEVWQWNDADRHNVPPDSFVDVIGMVADDAHTVPIFTTTGQLISEDGRHFTKPGAKYFGQLLFQHPALKDLR
jgi:peptidoglycan/LPS O-acetylase OafA/YrhL